MADQVFYVRNKGTGIVHNVNKGHFALKSPEYEILNEAEAKKALKSDAGRKTINAQSKDKGE